MDLAGDMPTQVWIFSSTSLPSRMRRAGTYIYFCSSPAHKKISQWILDNPVMMSCLIVFYIFFCSIKNMYDDLWPTREYTFSRSIFHFFIIHSENYWNMEEMMVCFCSTKNFFLWSSDTLVPFFGAGGHTSLKWGAWRNTKNKVAVLLKKKWSTTGLFFSMDCYVWDSITINSFFYATCHASFYSCSIRMSSISIMDFTLVGDKYSLEKGENKKKWRREKKCT